MWKARQVGTLWEKTLEHIKGVLGVVLALLVGWAVQLMFPQAPLWLVWSLAALAAVSWLAIHYRERMANLLHNVRKRRLKRAQEEGASSPIAGTVSAHSAVARPAGKWIDESEAIQLITASSLVQLRLPNETMTIGEALLRSGGIITSRTKSSIRAKEIARHLLKTYNDECAWGQRDGRYYKEDLENWINEKAYEDHAATRSL